MARSYLAELQNIMGGPFEPLAEERERAHREAKRIAGFEVIDERPGYLEIMVPELGVAQVSRKGEEWRVFDDAGRYYFSAPSRAAAVRRIKRERPRRRMYGMDFG